MILLIYFVCVLPKSSRNEYAVRLESNGLHCFVCYFLSLSLLGEYEMYEM